MCGIFAYLGFYPKDLSAYYQRIKHRGPDNTHIQQITQELLMVFHRLAINGLDEISNQPMDIDDVVLICNGEIYNYQSLIVNFRIKYQTHSDCEIIIHLYRRFGIEQMVQMLDGVFAFVLYDKRMGLIYAARDAIGIRPLFYAMKNNRMIAFASEAKALVGIGGVEENVMIQQFPVGSYWSNREANIFYPYFDYSKFLVSGVVSGVGVDDENQICERIRELLINAVNKRMMSNRKICTLLSGGVDSSLITALVAKNFPRGMVNTYSIGLEGSVDLKFAKMVADYLGTNHHEVIVSEEEFLSAIPKTIYQIESFCTTSVRASVGNYLVSLYIKKNNLGLKNDGDTVVFCGDLADEIFGSYRGFQKAKNETEFQRANVKMLSDVAFFDVLRSDRTISGAGLEPRAPFEDGDLVDYVMKIPAKFKMFNTHRMEKYILRKAFDGTGLLPDEILWRRKEAFSDGVSSQTRSWFQIIREYVDTLISDAEYEERVGKYDYLPPYDKESLWYREIFEKYYAGHSQMIPYYWRHPFCEGVLDPSARLLDIY